MKNTLVLLKSWGNISNAERIASYIHPKNVTISTGLRNLDSIKPNNECNSLIPYSNGLGSTGQNHWLTRAPRPVAAAAISGVTSHWDHACMILGARDFDD
jgi:hypothetical protein